MTELLTHQMPEAIEVERRTPVLISGLPGRMAALVAESLERSEQFELLPVGMTSYRHRRSSQIFENGKGVALVDYCPLDIARGTIAVDYTNARSAEMNAVSYTSLRIPFVMGTTGGDRDRIEQMVRNSEISAVVAPNMAANVVEVQDELDKLIETSPNEFRGWTMSIRESHQAAKRDVSGTARAFQAQLEGLGAQMSGEIESIRDPYLQSNLGIQNLDGHAYHWINLSGPNGETREFRTQIEGRQPYVEGTLLAIEFLDRQIRSGSRGEVFSMSDVIADARS